MTEKTGKKDCIAPPVTGVAKRALAEAEVRRKAAQAARDSARPPELGGRKGPEPTRFGDWEKDGITSDFS